jgi:ATP-dependent Lhr-like helicase
MPKGARQLQASSSLFYDVFNKYEPENRLLGQAQEEVLRQELDVDRLAETLRALQALTLDWRRLERPTPLAFPLLVTRMRESSSSEKLADRIARMVADLERAAGEGDPRPTPIAGTPALDASDDLPSRRRERVRKDGRPRTRSAT